MLIATIIETPTNPLGVPRLCRWGSLRGVAVHQAHFHSKQTPCSKGFVHQHKPLWSGQVYYRGRATPIRVRSWRGALQRHHTEFAAGSGFDLLVPWLCVSKTLVWRPAGEGTRGRVARRDLAAQLTRQLCGPRLGWKRARWKVVGVRTVEVAGGRS